MAQTFPLSVEQDLTVNQGAIEDFYLAVVRHHQIKRSPELTLSAIELRPDNYERTLVIVPGRAETEHKYAEFLYSMRNLPYRIVITFVRGQDHSRHPEMPY